MAESSRHDPANGNTITQQEYEDMNAPHMPSGVIGSVGDTSIVYADGSARVVKIRANKRASVRGRTWYNDAAEVQVPIAANASGSTRIDTVVLRLTRSNWQVRTAIVQGTPGAGAPALTQQTDSGNTVWELPIADVTVANAASVISAGNVKSREWYVSPSGDLMSALGITPPVGFGVGQRWNDTVSDRRYNGAKWLRDPVRVAPTVKAQFVNATAPADVAGMSIPLEAGGVYPLDALIKVGGLQFTGCTLFLQLPAGATFDGYVHGWRDDTGAYQPSLINSGSGSVQLGLVGYGYNGGTNFSPVLVRGTITVGATPGSATLRGAQRVANGSAASTVELPSWMELRQVA